MAFYKAGSAGISHCARLELLFLSQNLTKAILRLPARSYM
jgi:hypothetical protein